MSLGVGLSSFLKGVCFKVTIWGRILNYLKAQLL